MSCCWEEGFNRGAMTSPKLCESEDMGVDIAPTVPTLRGGFGLGNLGFPSIDTRNTRTSKDWQPHNMLYFEYEKRLSSFAAWPQQICQKPRELAASGFYYTGLHDQVKCFGCGVSIQDWETSDTIDYEHYRFRSNCQFLICRGLDKKIVERARAPAIHCL